jgi:DNA-binding transcriptional ArsR family regulator
MAHPVRRTLLETVRANPSRVTDLADGFDISLAAVSRHVKVLERAGLVRRSVEGRDHVISASPQAWTEMAAWIEGQSADWRARLSVLKSVMEAPDGDA